MHKQMYQVLDRATSKHEHTWILFTDAESLGTCTVEKLKHTISYSVQQREWRVDTTLKIILCQPLSSMEPCCPLIGTWI